MEEALNAHNRLVADGVIGDLCDCGRGGGGVLHVADKSAKGSDEEGAGA
jgi:hypothetical protein